MPVIQKATAIATAIVTATMITVAITGLIPFLLATVTLWNAGFYFFRYSSAAARSPSGVSL
jgi:hypothetical protein